MFEGDYLNGKRWNGKGYDKNNKIVYELKNGNGHVKEYGYIGNCLVFEGEYLNGEKNGKGKDYNIWTGVLQFEGEYLNDKRWNGKVKEYKFEELKFEGEYINGEKKGTYYNNDSDDSIDSRSDLFRD